MRSRPRAAVLLAVGALAVAGGACGDDGPGQGSYTEPVGEPVAELAVDAGNVYFEPRDLAAPPGVVRIEMVNVEDGPHTLVIEGVKGYELRVQRKGDRDAAKVDLTPGSYDFWCTIPGHRAAGMEGVLTVG